jgi:hypothetical protein
MPEMKVVAFVNFPRLQSLLQNIVRKMMRRHERKIAREGKQQDGIDPGFAQKAKFFGQGTDQLEIGIGPQNPDGMRLERDRNRAAGLGFRPFHDVRQNSAMGAMHAVKVADADYAGSEASWDLFEFVKNMHCFVTAICRKHSLAITH